MTTYSVRAVAPRRDRTGTRARVELFALGLVRCTTFARRGQVLRRRGRVRIAEAVEGANVHLPPRPRRCRSAA